MPSAFLTTLADLAQIPGMFKSGFLLGHADPRIAFVGRSNVGKSSLINRIVGERVARVSATPGKTRAIQFFRWFREGRIVVDLPGYGFALRAKKEKHLWKHLLDGYFEADEGLHQVILLWDSRHGPTDQDEEALIYFLEKRVPTQIIMTKVDQLKTQSERSRRKKEVAEYLEQFARSNSELGAPDQLLWVSIRDQKSIEAIRRILI